MEHGTGRAARALLPPTLVVAGKSGTSSDYRDSWFAGFSGSHLAVVWVGYDDNVPTGLHRLRRRAAGVGARHGGPGHDAPGTRRCPSRSSRCTSSTRAACARCRAVPRTSSRSPCPPDAQLPGKPGCGFPDTPAATTPNPLSTLKEKAEQLLQRIVH